MSRFRGKNLTKYELQRIQMLLADTDLAMPLIAERMNCSRGNVARINKALRIRSYSGQRSNWAIAGVP